MTTTKLVRAQKGKIFFVGEERRLCRSYLHGSQDLFRGNGLHLLAKWERIASHYQENQPRRRGEESGQHERWKQSGVWFNVMSPSSLACTMRCLHLESYGLRLMKFGWLLWNSKRVKQPKQHSFVFIHLLVDIKRRSSVDWLCEGGSDNLCCCNSTGVDAQEESCLNVLSCWTVNMLT